MVHCEHVWRCLLAWFIGVVHYFSPGLLVRRYLDVVAVRPVISVPQQQSGVGGESGEGGGGEGRNSVRDERGIIGRQLLPERGDHVRLSQLYQDAPGAELVARVARVPVVVPRAPVQQCIATATDPFQNCRTGRDACNILLGH